MKEREIITERKILDVLYALSYDREIAMNSDNEKLAREIHKKFNRLVRQAHKLGYNSYDTLKVDLQGRINASTEINAIESKLFYQECLRNLEKKF